MSAVVCRADSVLSRFLAKPNDKLINAVKRIIKYLVKTKDLGITWKITPEDRWFSIMVVEITVDRDTQLSRSRIRNSCGFHLRSKIREGIGSWVGVWANRAYLDLRG